METQDTLTLWDISSGPSADNEREASIVFAAALVENFPMTQYLTYITPIDLMSSI